MPFTFKLPSDPQTAIALAQLALGLATGLAATVAFIVGLRQYERGQRWQKAQVLLSLINSFESDPLIRAAKIMLDWHSRNNLQIDGVTIPFTDQLLESALRFGGRVEDPYREITPEEGKIRDAFDALFDFLEKVDSLVQGKLVQFTDLFYFYYWLDRLANISRFKRDTNISQVMDPLRCCGMSRGVRRRASGQAHWQRAAPSYS